jgi:LysM repeat protein
MKQNERLLVYAVTGFLALILVIAVVFGNDPGRDGGKGNAAKGLDEILSGAVAEKSGEKPAEKPEGGAGSRTGIEPPARPVGESLVAKPLPTAELLALKLGPSERDPHAPFVRWVYAKSGDSLALLVRRWCGEGAGLLDEAMKLNEGLVIVRPGQRIGVPYVDDGELLAMVEAREPKLSPVAAAAQPVVPAVGAPMSGPTSAPTSGPAIAATNAPAGLAPAPDFRLPGTASAAERGVANASLVPGSRQPASSVGKVYTVVAGDSLWRIAERNYGAGKADQMIREIKANNPGLTDAIKVGQVIRLP